MRDDGLPKESQPRVIEINSNISIWFENGPTSSKLGFNKQRISIQRRWFDVLSPSELIRKRNETDGYYRVVYLQINWATSEYYIGKANRCKWSEIKRYQGSGLKFKSKFKKYKNEFVRYFLASCETAEETEHLEASIVTEDLLCDEKCLNLVAGGGGISNRPQRAETSQKKREYMKNHPERFRPMLEAAKKAFVSGSTPALLARSKRIKEVMSSEKYREMSRDRITNWKNQNPDEYALARKKNHEKIKAPEVQAKRKASLKKYAKENPDAFKAWQEKLIQSRTSPEANNKRKLSLKRFNKENPEAAHTNAKRRAMSAAAQTSKSVSMLDLDSGKVLKEFASIHEAARWLTKEGIAKNTNCVSSISSVCLRKPCTTGYGYRKKAYGYGWRFNTVI